MQTEVGEVSEPYVPHRGSSSTMPNKFNPISCVYIHALSATVRQYSAALMDAMVEDHERSTGPWEIGNLRSIVVKRLVKYKTTAFLLRQKFLKAEQDDESQKLP